MVKLKKKYALYLHNDDENALSDVITVVMNVAGYDVTRASNIAYMAHRAGKYRFMTLDDRVSAKVTQAMFTRHGLTTEIQTIYE